MSWSRAVWIENEEEMEAVIPSNWIQNGKVYWPSKMNVKKAFKEQVDPEENQLMFPLIKVKLKDGKLLYIWLIHKIFAFHCVLNLQMCCFSKFIEMMTIINFVESCPFKLNPQNIIPIKFNHHHHNEGLIFRHFLGMSVSLDDCFSNTQNRLILEAEVPNIFNIFDMPCARGSLYFLKSFLF